MKKLPDDLTIGEAKKLGRYGDEALVHLNKSEVKMLENMTYGHGLTINPATGEKEAFLPFLLSALPALFPTLGASLAGATGLGFLANPMMLGAIGSGLGTAIETGDVGKGLMAGLGGAALGGLGGMFGGAGGAVANAAAKSAAPAAAQGLGQAAANASTKAVQQAAANAATGGGMGMLGGMLAGAPGAMIVANDQMKTGVTDKDRRREAAIARAQHENFMTPRQQVAAPPGYRHGLQGEHSFFGPSGTLTPVSTTRGYAGGGPVRMTSPTALGNTAFAQPEVLASSGLWGGLQMPTPQVPASVTSPIVPTTPMGQRVPALRAGGNGATEAMSRAVLGMRPGGGTMLSRFNRPVHSYADGGLVMGPGDGTSDSIPALINGQEPAAISDGEFIIPAMAVAKLGNGSTEAGAAKLQAMVDQLIQ